jgi:rubrerythrin
MLTPLPNMNFRESKGHERVEIMENESNDNSVEQELTNDIRKTSGESKSSVSNKKQRSSAPHALRKGSVSVAEAHPELEAEWDYERNGNLLPQQVSTGSSRKVWWKCATCGYEWEAYVHNRVKKGTGCPACAGRVPRVGDNDVATLYPDLMLDWNWQANKGLNPTKLMRTNSVNVAWKCHVCGNEWITALVTRTLHDSGCPVCRDRDRVERGSLMVERYPDVASEWNFIKNRSIDIMAISQYSDTKVWWRCRECGYEWEARVRNRTNGRTGCPRCAERRKVHRVVESFAEQGGIVVVGVTFDSEAGTVFSGLGRCGRIRLYELPVGFDVSQVGTVGGSRVKVKSEVHQDGEGLSRPDQVVFAKVRDLDCEGLKREGIMRLLNEERVTFFITGELGGNAMVSMSATGTTCYYDVKGDAETRVRELLVGKLRAKELAHGKVQRL